MVRLPTRLPQTQLKGHGPSHPLSRELTRSRVRRLQRSGEIALMERAAAGETALHAHCGEALVERTGCYDPVATVNDREGRPRVIAGRARRID
jgi:hypothetical protein